MSADEKYAEAAQLEKRAAELKAEAGAERHAELRALPLLDRLVFAATARCDCGAGLAYDPAHEEPGSVFKGPSFWDCSAIILGTATPSGQPGAVKHTDRLPFAFYSVKSEGQPSACGQTTRPTVAAAQTDL